MRLHLLLLVAWNGCSSQRPAEQVPIYVPTPMIVALPTPTPEPLPSPTVIEMPQATPPEVVVTLAPQRATQPSEQEEAAPTTTERATTSTTYVTERTPGEQRDLANELGRAIGVPLDCIPESARDTLPASFIVQVSASVDSSGEIARANAEGPINFAAADCIEQRANSVRLEGPIADAPKTINVPIQVNVRAGY